MLKIVVMFILLFGSCLAGDRVPVSVMRIVDGDSVVVWTGENEVIVRMVGIDCPEFHHNQKAEKDAKEWGIPLSDVFHAGRSARNFLSSISPNGMGITMEVTGEDKYKRTLAYLYLQDGRCLNETLLRNGVALSRYRHKKYDEYKEFENAARIGRRGFWNTIWKEKGE